MFSIQLQKLILNNQVMRQWHDLPKLLECFYEGLLTLSLSVFKPIDNITPILK